MNQADGDLGAVGNEGHDSGTMPSANSDSDKLVGLSQSESQSTWADVTTIAAAIFGVLVALWAGAVVAIPLAAIAWVLAARLSGRSLSRRIWILCGTIFAIGGVSLLGMGDDGTQPLDVTLTVVDHPSEDRFYENLHPIAGDRMSGYLNETDGFIALDLQFAVESHEGEPLEDVTLELRYPSDLPVDSIGIERVDPTGEAGVYEHRLGTIQPGEPYPAIEEPDQLQLPVDFSVDERCWLDDVQMPVCSVLTWDSTMGEHSQECFSVEGVVACLTMSKDPVPPPTTIDIDYTVRASGRPPLEGTLVLTLDEGKPMSTMDAGSTVLQTARGDVDWDAPAVAANFGPVEGEVLEEWTRPWGQSDHIVSYRKVVTVDAEVHQELSVNGILRKVFIGRDNWVGEQITNVDDSPEPDVSKVFSRFWMLEWRESDFEGIEV